MKRRLHALTCSCSLACSWWCPSWAWPCTAQAGGIHNERASSWRPLWLFTCFTWSSLFGVVGCGWPCSYEEQSQDGTYWAHPLWWDTCAKLSGLFDIQLKVHEWVRCIFKDNASEPWRQCWGVLIFRSVQDSLTIWQTSLCHFGWDSAAEGVPRKCAWWRLKFFKS